MKNNRCCRKDVKNLVNEIFQFHINFANSVSHELWQHLVIIDNSNKEIFVLEKEHELNYLAEYNGLGIFGWRTNVQHLWTQLVLCLLKLMPLIQKFDNLSSVQNWPYLYHFCTKCMICFFHCFLYIVLVFAIFEAHRRVCLPAKQVFTIN